MQSKAKDLNDSSDEIDWEDLAEGVPPRQDLRMDASVPRVAPLHQEKTQPKLIQSVARTIKSTASLGTFRENPLSKPPQRNFLVNQQKNLVKAAVSQSPTSFFLLKEDMKVNDKYLGHPTSQDSKLDNNLTKMHLAPTRSLRAFTGRNQNEQQNTTSQLGGIINGPRSKICQLGIIEEARNNFMNNGKCKLFRDSHDIDIQDMDDDDDYSDTELSSCDEGLNGRQHFAMSISISKPKPCNPSVRANPVCQSQPNFAKVALINNQKRFQQQQSQLSNQQLTAFRSLDGASTTVDSSTHHQHQQQQDYLNINKSSCGESTTFKFASKYDIPTSIQGFDGKDTANGDTVVQRSSSFLFNRMPTIHLPAQLDVFGESICESAVIGDQQYQEQDDEVVFNCSFNENFSEEKDEKYEDLKQKVAEPSCTMVDNHNYDEEPSYKFQSSCVSSEDENSYTL